MNDVLDGNLRVKVSQRELDIFFTKCARMGIPGPHMIREIIGAFNEGNLKIIDPRKRELGDLYEH